MSYTGGFLMKEIPILEIPIYSMSPQKFSDKWNNFFKNNFPQNHLLNDIKRTYYPLNIWQYNQIIGYITISCSKNDIWFEEYLSFNKEKFWFRSKNKVFVQKMNLNGFHFRIEPDDTNETIRNQILEWLDYLLDDKIFKNINIDISVFDIQLHNIDIIKIINEL